MGKCLFHLFECLAMNCICHSFMKQKSETSLEWPGELEKAWNEAESSRERVSGSVTLPGYLWWPCHRSSSVMGGEHAGDWEPSQTPPVGCGCVGTLHDHCRAGAPASPLLLGTPSLRVLLSHQCHSVWMKLIFLGLPLLSRLLLLSPKSMDSLDLLPIPQHT